ncbi:putative transcription initiation factor tfiid subunit 7 [Diaporthe ampelina]|uniref:Putative transcription initiation factor tfiid subunit 7 n=1 Tax=Diaporthe ampelina TaxID=1214573 RepID=A0A0G2H2S4_9PEZI|nr:putative transcription initiation factor tfiid subunit 7 [Diaporthe ampelina]
MTKAGRTSKPTAKKRAKADADSGDEARTNGNVQEPAKKKMRTIKLKSGPEAPSARRNSSFRIAIKDSHKSTFYRENGSGYDSEMEDAEEDPIVEEQIVLRMMEGPECDYINACLDSKKFPSGGMDFKLRWLNERRALVTVQGRMYAAVLVDMPTITEGMKTWDKKLMVKSADISQMLLVFARVNDEASARIAELPKVIFDGHRWPHGLTPPMHDAVHRRFRKRLHKSEILNKEQEVQRLLQEDKNAISTRYEWIDERRDTVQAGTPDLDLQDAEGDEDAEGEIDEGWDMGANDMDMIDADIEAQLEAELNDLGSEMAETPAQEGATPAAFAPETPTARADAAELNNGDKASVEGESGEDYDDDDDDSDDDANEEERERREQVRGVREDVRDIQKQIAVLESELVTKNNPLLRKRIEGRIKGHKEDLLLKLASIGEVPPEDEDQDD